MNVKRNKSCRLVRMRSVDVEIEGKKPYFLFIWNVNRHKMWDSSSSPAKYSFLATSYISLHLRHQQLILNSDNPRWAKIT